MLRIEKPIAESYCLVDVQADQGIDAVDDFSFKQRKSVLVDWLFCSLLQPSLEHDVFLHNPREPVLHLHISELGRDILLAGNQQLQTLQVVFLLFVQI